MTNTPAILQLGQYLKDLSFENFTLEGPAPATPGVEVNIQVDIRALSAPPTPQDRLVSGDYETMLKISVNGQRNASGQSDAATPGNDKPLFIVEITYGGRFRIANVPAAELEPFLAIEAPRLLFPFVRQIIAEAAMHGGMPPLLIAPVDFLAIYQQQKGNISKNA